MNVKQVIDKALELTNAGDIMIGKQMTQDRLIEGSFDADVKGVAVTFICSMEVIKKAAELGVNLIITHEPTYYNGTDDGDWLADDTVFRCKKKLIKDNGISIWRMHDALHIMKPDGIVEGVIKRLMWEKCTIERLWGGAVIEIPSSNFYDVAQYVKERLRASSLRIAGNTDINVSRVGIMVGAQGGRDQIMFYSKHNVDLLICGEIREWEASEYARDCMYSNEKRALIITGHYESEEAGMEYFAGLVKSQIPDIPVTYIDSGKPFKFL